MKMNKDNKHITELFKRYFLGEITDNEAGELTNWLRESPDNMTRFDKAKEEWQGEKTNLLAQSNWLQLKNKVNRLNQLDINIGSKSVHQVKWLKIALVAAVIVTLGIGSLLMLLLQDTSNRYDNLVFETPRGNRSKVVLGDSTIIWLNADTRIEVLALNKDERIVSLQGQAHFEVTRNIHSPFVVHTNDYDITVLGTVFDVMAYDDMNRTVTTLFEGKVKVSNDVSDIVLNPGQQVVWEKDKLEVSETENTESTKAWVRNDFNFDNIALGELLKQLERWYDVDFEYNKEELSEFRFTGVFKNEETVWQVLNAIKLYIPIKYEKTGLRKIKITRIK